jgi:hypothetical protein
MVELSAAGPDAVCTLAIDGISGRLGEQTRVHGVDAMGALASALRLADEILRLTAVDADLRWLDGSRYEPNGGSTAA